MWLRYNLAGAVQQYTAFLLAIVGLVQRHGLTVMWIILLVNESVISRVRSKGKLSDMPFFCAVIRRSLFVLMDVF